MALYRLLLCSLPGVKYLDVAQQETLGYVVTALLPYDNYARKILGYLYAIQVIRHVL